MTTTSDICNYNDIMLLVQSFYTKTLKDEIIGEIFTQVAQINIEDHLPIMYRFWDSLLFQTGSYHGQAMQKHIFLNQKHTLQPHHFARWLALFHETVDEHFAGPMAERAKVRATAIAKTIQLRIQKTEHSLLL